MTRRQFGTATAATVAAVATAGTATAQESGWTQGREGLNWSSEYVQNTYIEEGSLRRARHKLAWGDGDDALAAYEDDSGNKAMLPGFVPREDTENVLTLRADKFDFPAASKFPRGESYDADGDGDENAEVSALDATHWTTTGATNGSVTVMDGDVDVEDSLVIESSGVASGETVTAEFSLVDISDSAAKRFLQFVANVDALQSGATVTVAVVDDDGDRKEVTASPSADGSTDSVFATSSGSGVVSQNRLAELGTTANGDGSFDSIASVEVSVSEADATLTFTALDVEAKSQWLFGSYLADEDTDDEERMKRWEPSGSYTVTGLDTLGDTLGNSETVIHDVEQPFRYTMEDSTLAYEFKFAEATDRPGYDFEFMQRGKLEVPTAIELTHSGLSMRSDVEVPASRYNQVWSAAGLADMELSALEDSDKTFHTGLFSGEGETVTLRDAPTSATEYGVGFTLLATSENRSASTGSRGGGGVAPGEGGGDGKLAMMFGLITAIFGGVVGKARGLF